MPNDDVLNVRLDVIRAIKRMKQKARDEPDADCCSRNKIFIFNFKVKDYLFVYFKR